MRPIECDGAAGDRQDPIFDEALRALAKRVRPDRRLVRIRRDPVVTASSWTLELTELVFDRGESYRVIFKDLSRRLPAVEDGAFKPRAILDPTRELWAYRNLLSAGELSSPKLLHSVSDEQADRHWLFLEPVDGIHLFEASFGSAWEAAAQWLARFHAGFLDPCSEASPLIRHTPETHRWWFRRALAIHDAPVAHLAGAHERAISLLLEGPLSALHGEFYPSNILVEKNTGLIHPVDWEMAGIGPPLLDLAALSAGLSSRERQALLHAYLDEADRSGVPVPEGPIDSAMAACRLLLAVQWLGWAPDWKPPSEHQFDWLSEATLTAAEIVA